MRRSAEVSSFNLMYTLCMYYEKQKSYDKTELTFQPTLVHTIFSKLLQITDVKAIGLKSFKSLA